MTRDDELNRRLTALAADIDPRRPHHDEVVARARRRQVRRRAGVVVASLAAVVAIVSVVVAFDGDAETDVATEGVPEVDTPDADAPAPSSTTTMVPMPMDGDTAGATSVAFGVGGPGWVVPWGEGFLSVESVYDSPPLPGPDSEFADLFPPEIIEAVEAAGATTLQEAIDALSQAGLLELATEIANANPGLYAEVTAGGTSRIIARVSGDGGTWREIDLAIPGGADSLGSLRSDGEHLAVSAQHWTESGTTRISVSYTDDLSTWTTIDIPLEAPTDVPDLTTVGFAPGALALGPDGWVLTVDTWLDFDPARVLPDDVRAMLDAGGTQDFDLGWGTSEQGIEVQRYTGETSEPEVIWSATWAELGVDPAAVDGLFDGRAASMVWSGGWDGSARRSATPSSSSGLLVATDAGLVATGYGDQGGSLWFSADGSSWERREPPVGSAWIDSLVTLDGGVLLGTSDGLASRLHRGAGDATGWEPVEVPGLPVAGHPDVSHPVAMSEGGGASGVAAVIDVATHDLVLPEVLADVPPPTETASAPVVPDLHSSEPYVPDLWLVASADGLDWLVEDLPDPDPTGDWWPWVAAINGDRVVFAAANGWEVRDLG